MTNTKYCNNCNQTRSRDEFTPDPRNKDGLQGICKPCRKIVKQAARDKRAAEGPLVRVSSKTCNKCDITKPSDEFYRDTGLADGLGTICKDCKNEASAKWKAVNRDTYNASMREWRANNKDEAKDSDLNRCYGISLEVYKGMLETQNHVCALCSKAAQGKRPLCVDHCHDTGKVRGLLCYGCNRLMALVDNPVLLEKALKYKNK